MSATGRNRGRTRPEQRAAAADEERARIVAWLRGRQNLTWRLGDVADNIENGAHAEPMKAPCATNARLSNGVNEWTPFERVNLWRRGFVDGTARRPLREGHEGLIDYETGYKQGQDAVIAASNAYTKLVGYKPEILR